MPQSVDNDLIAEAERLLGGRTRDIRLNRALSAAFRERSFEQTSKIVRSWMSWVVLLDFIATGANLVLLPYDVGVAMLLPAAFILPSAMFVRWIWGKRRPDWAIDYALLVGVVGILTSVSMTGVVAGGEFQERYLSIMLFVAVSAIIIFNVPMQITILVATAGMAIYLVLQLMNPTLTVYSTVSAFVFFSSGLAAMVVARRTATMLAQRSFLLELRDASRAQKLITMNGRLETLSKTDPLTGLPNRRYMDETLAAISVAPKELTTGLAVLMCDIDYFKRLNDQLGHAEGDKCLVSVGRALAETLRPDRDHVARFGGEEFLVLLKEVTPSQALTVAERLRTRVEALQLSNPKSPIGGMVSISIGVAFAGRSAAGASGQLIEEADQALYSAKAKGRNCVMLSKKAKAHA